MQSIDPVPGLDGMPSGVGPPSWFVGFAVLLVVTGIGLTLWRMTLARQVARRAGMDPNQAAAMTLLSDDGLDSTYLLANLRPGAQRPAAPLGQAAEPLAGESSTAARLRELQRLRDRDLISVAEYDARRTAILDSV